MNGLKLRSPEELIYNIKHSEEYRDFRLQIEDSDGTVIGYLLPFNEERCQSPILHEKLAQWRNRFRKHFFTQEQASAQQTCEYLNNVVLHDPGRVLFLLTLPDDRPVGVEGLCHVKRCTGDLSNLIRGEMGGHARLVWHAEQTLITWAFSELKLKRIRCCIIAGNVLAKHFHESIGFVIVSPDVFNEKEKQERNLPLDARFEVLELTKSRYNKINEGRPGPSFDSSTKV